MSMSFIEKLNAKKQNNAIINEISTKLAAITGKQVWVEYNWKSGKMMGILRTLSLNRNIPGIFDMVDIEEEVIDMYYETAGNLPYIDKNGMINVGRPQHCNEYVELLKYIYDELGMTYDDNEFTDINQERWDSLYYSNMERIKKTLEVTTNTIQYDE